jgi:hypothetical protein
MKIKLLTALLFVLPVPAAFYICVCHPTFTIATAVVLITGYVFVRILRIVDPSDNQVKSKPTTTAQTISESGDHIWPPQPADDVDDRRKDSRRISTIWRRFRLRPLWTA